MLTSAEVFWNADFTDDADLTQIDFLIRPSTSPFDKLRKLRKQSALNVHRLTDAKKEIYS